MGKGTIKRMNSSERRIKRLHTTECIDKKFYPCKNDKDAFIKEYDLLNALYGPKGGKVYNKIQSPGKKLKGN